MTPARTILPAFYLACSWTWVIGMWFPVLLAGDFGWPSWLVFAVPNILGAASVGAVLSASGAGRFAHDHRAACLTFSVVTIAFQVFAVCWLCRRILSPSGIDFGPIVSVSVALFIATILGVAALPFRAGVAAAAGVFLASAGAVVYTQTAGDPFLALRLPPVDGTLSHLDLAFAGAGITLGFAFCPYLDVTFLRLRASLDDRVGPLAFAIGFAGPFLLLVALTLGYAGTWVATGTIAPALMLHIGVQAAFTAGLHLRDASRAGLLTKPRHQPRQSPDRTPRRPALRRLFTVTTFILFMIPLGTAADDLPAQFGKPAWRFIYESFMFCYALPFPAYVYIVAGPLLRTAPFRRRLTVWVVACIAAAPLMAVGYLGERYLLVPIAVALVLLAPAVARVAIKNREGPSLRDGNDLPPAAG